MLMSRINHICAWVLLASVVLYFLTGFDIQGRFLSPTVSSLIHLKYIFLPALLAFAFHASYAINAAFTRWNFIRPLRIGLVMFFLALNVSFLGYYAYIQFFR
jgi:hypothetical protein